MVNHFRNSHKKKQSRCRGRHPASGGDAHVQLSTIHEDSAAEEEERQWQEYLQGAGLEVVVLRSGIVYCACHGVRASPLCFAPPRRCVRHRGTAGESQPLARFATSSAGESLQRLLLLWLLLLVRKSPSDCSDNIVSALLGEVSCFLESQS